MQLHLLLQRAAPGQESLCPLLRGLLPPVCFPGFFDGLGTGLPRGRQQRLGLLIIKIAPTVREGGSRLQLAPLHNQPKALGLKARILTSEFLTKQAHRVSRPPEEPLAKRATLPGALEYILHTIICRKQAPWGADQHSPSGRGLGACALEISGRALPRARPKASPSPSKERWEYPSQSRSTARREAHGRLAMPREGPRWKTAGSAGPSCVSR